MFLALNKRSASSKTLLASMILLLLALAGCGDSPSPAATPTVGSASTPAAGATSTANPTSGIPLPTVPADMPPTSTLQIDNYTFVQNGTSLAIFGAVTNPGPAVLGRLEISAIARDSAGAEIGTGEAVYLTYVELWPGKSAPFRINIGVDGETASVALTGQAENNAPSETNAIAESIEIINAQLSLPEGAVPVLTGLVRNAGTLPASDPDVGVIAYDAAGKVVNVGRDEVLIDNLAPGAVAPFRVPLDTVSAVERFDTLVTASAGSAPAPTGLELGETTYYQDGTYVTAIGVVRNTGTITLEHVRIAVYAESEAGAVVAVAADDYLDATEIQIGPGKSAPFRASMEVPLEDVAGVKLVGEADQFSADDFNFSVPAQLSATGVTLDGSNVTGEVKNDGAVAANSIVVLLIGYDAAGTPVNVARQGLLGVSELAPGATAPFDVSFERSDVEVERAEVLVTGLEVQQ